jgi:hypothetical protein
MPVRRQDESVAACLPPPEMPQFGRTPIQTLEYKIRRD